MYFLAIDYGMEGWNLNPVDSPQEALEIVQNGETYGSPWKILKEVEILIKEEKEGK